MTSAMGCCSAFSVVRIRLIAFSMSVLMRKASGFVPSTWLQVGHLGVTPLALQPRIHSARHGRQNVSAGRGGLSRDALVLATFKTTGHTQMRRQHSRDRQAAVVGCSHVSVQMVHRKASIRTRRRSRPSRRRARRRGRPPRPRWRRRAQPASATTTPRRGRV